MAWGRKYTKYAICITSARSALWIWGSEIPLKCTKFLLNFSKWDEEEKEEEEEKKHRVRNANKQ